MDIGNGSVVAIIINLFEPKLTDPKSYEFYDRMATGGIADKTQRNQSRAVQQGYAAAVRGAKARLHLHCIRANGETPTVSAFLLC